MRITLTFLASLSVALLLALLAVLWRPESKSLVLGLLGLFISSPAWVCWGRRLLNWFARQDIFSPLIAFPLGYIAWFTLGSIDFFQLPNSISFGAFDPIPPRVLVYAGIGLVGYLCGAKSAMSTSREWQSNRVLHFRFTWEPKMFRLALFALVSVAVITYLHIAYHIGIPLLSPDAGESRLEIANYHWAGTPFFVSAYTVIFLVLGGIWTGSPLAPDYRTRLVSIGGLLLIFLVFMSMAGRAIIVPPILTGMILYHYLRKPIQIRKLAIIVVALFAFLSVYGYLRDLTVGDSMTVWLEDARLPRSIQPFVYCYLYVRYSVATLRDVTAVIPTQVPYQLGAITFLPFQSVLPGHHQMADVFFKNLLGNEFLGAGQPATVLGAFYADLGPVGIFVGMFAWGLLLANLYRWMLRDRSLFATMIFAWATQAGLFGLFGGVFTYLDTFMIPMCWVLLNLFIRHSTVHPALPTAQSTSPTGLSRLSRAT